MSSESSKFDAWKELKTVLKDNQLYYMSTKDLLDAMETNPLFEYWHNSYQKSTIRTNYTRIRGELILEYGPCRPPPPPPSDAGKVSDEDFLALH